MQFRHPVFDEIGSRSTSAWFEQAIASCHTPALARNEVIAPQAGWSHLLIMHVASRDR